MPSGRALGVRPLTVFCHFLPENNIFLKPCGVKFFRSREYRKIPSLYPVESQMHLGVARGSVKETS
jgi:hypothetical protein